MRVDFLIPVFLAAALLSAKAQSASPSPEPAPAALDIPVEIGQDVKNIRFPQYEKDGKLSMKFNATNAERSSDTQFLFKDLHIELFDQTPEKPSMEIFLDAAVFDRNTSLLTSQSRAKITGENFEIVGEQIEFDSKSRSSRLQGPVTMTITQIEQSDSK